MCAMAGKALALTVDQVKTITSADPRGYIRNAFASRDYGVTNEDVPPLDPIFASKAFQYGVANEYSKDWEIK